MTPRTSRLVRWGISLAVGGGAALYLSRFPWGDVWEHLRGASLWLATLAVGAHSLTYAVRAAMWWILLRAIGVGSASLALRGTVLVNGLNNLVVGNVGEAGRVLVVTRETGVAASAVAATIAVERLIATATHAVATLLAGLWVTLPPELSRLRWGALAVLGALGIVVGGLAWRTRPDRRRAERAGAALRLGTEQAWGGLWRVRAAFTAFAASARTIASPRRTAFAMTLSVVWWLLSVASFHLAALALGLPITIGGSAVAFLAVSGATTLRATPANVGVTQFAYTATAGFFGLDATTAMGVSVLVLGMQTLPVVLASLPLMPALWAARAAQHVPLEPRGSRTARSPEAPARAGGCPR